MNEKTEPIEKIEPSKIMNDKESWAFGILSDAQELISMGLYEEAQEKIKRAKYVLQGKYVEVVPGFSIKVLTE